ncbi:chemotaxis protein CheB [Dyadobacter alkalitolerans]|uniref:chemotaxis protein CheB n=1 Tax=Dyadobacter alkalitolerans TaxID=492736 RepID=UPI00054E7276|nr:chemotaxis protein CheB [Dyadobacter alkalitolerans]
MAGSKKLFIVAIGFSAGGREDLHDFFSHLPKVPNAAFIVLQHLNRYHPSVADVLLAPSTNLPISWAADQDLVEANHIYLLAPNKLMTIAKGHLQTSDRDPQDRSNWAVDIFFKSLAIDAAAMAVGIILSGIGSDGAKGAASIHEHGGIVLVQDPGTALFDGMPVSAIIKDDPDGILSPRTLAYALTDYLLTR